MSIFLVNQLAYPSRLHQLVKIDNAEINSYIHRIFCGEYKSNETNLSKFTPLQN
jgi:hypothetical protein